MCIRQQEKQTLEKSIRTRWTARYINIDRQKLVNTLNNTVYIVHTTRISTRSHRYDPSGSHHLIIQPLYNWSHLKEDCTGDDHYICFPGCTTYHFSAESRNIIPAGKGGSHFNKTA